MDIKQLRYFQQVVSFGSISRAATAMSVAQPSVTRQIINLEHELGVPLLYRNGRGVTVTEAGQVLLGFANDIIARFDQAESALREVRGVPKGKVILGTPPSATQVIVVPLIRALREKHPLIQLQVVEAFSGYVNEWLTNGRIDIAVLYNPARASHVMTDKLLTEELHLIRAAGPGIGGGSIGLKEVAKLPLILPSPTHGLRFLVDRCANAAGIELNVVLEMDALQVTKELVQERGGAATILPYVLVERDVRDGRLVAQPIVDPSIRRDLVFSISTQRPLTLAARQVITELKAAVHGLVHAGLWQGATQTEPEPAVLEPAGSFRD